MKNFTPLLLAIVLYSITPNNAFLNPSTLSTKSTFTTSSSTIPQPFTKKQTSTTTTTSTTTIQMSEILEDFLAGTDNTKREKENESYISQLQDRVERINAMESDIEELGDDELMAKIVEFRQRLMDGEDINGKIIEEAFAVVREAAWRVLELRHYDVQLMGGFILHEGRLAEMATG